MTTPVIIDAFVVVVLVAFAIYGARRGLLRSLAGLVILIMALVGAGMIAATFAAPVSKVVSPWVEEAISERIEETVSSQISADEQDLFRGIGAGMDEIQDLLEDVGFPENLLGESEIKGQRHTDDGESAAELLLGAAVEGLVQSMVYGILYVISFILLLILLNVLLEAMGLVMKLPGLHTLNALGGGLLGLAEGALVLFLAVWVGRKLGISFESSLLAEAHILRIFTTYTPLNVLTFLQ